MKKKFEKQKFSIKKRKKNFFHKKLTQNFKNNKKIICSKINSKNIKKSEIKENKPKKWPKHSISGYLTNNTTFNSKF